MPDYNVTYTVSKERPLKKKGCIIFKGKTVRGTLKVSTVGRV